MVEPLSVLFFSIAWPVISVLTLLIGLVAVRTFSFIKYMDCYRTIRRCTWYDICVFLMALLARSSNSLSGADLK